MLEVIVQTDKYWSPAGHQLTASQFMLVTSWPQLTASQFMLVTSWPPCINRLAVSWGQLVTDQLATSWSPAGPSWSPAGPSWSPAGPSWPSVDYQLVTGRLSAFQHLFISLSPAGCQLVISRASAGHQPGISQL